MTAASLQPAVARLGELCVERILRRLVAQGRLLRPSARVAHWVLVPPECQSSAVLPPELWIDAYFGATLGVGYCVGLLSAAACYGAASPAPRLMHLERSRAAFALGLFELRFHAQPNLAVVPRRWQQQAPGRYQISTREMTALDLAKRQVRRAAGCDLKQVIERLFGQCTESDTQRALEAAPERRRGRAAGAGRAANCPAACRGHPGVAAGRRAASSRARTPGDDARRHRWQSAHQ